MSRYDISRRNVLKLTGASAALVGATGLGAGSNIDRDEVNGGSGGDRDEVNVSSGGDRIEVNVGFANGRGRTVARETATELRREFDELDAMTLVLPEEAVQSLENDPDIRYVEENGTMEALDTYPWGVERISSDVAHHDGYTGAGVDVAIIDTGIDPNHPDLTPNIGGGECFVSCTGGSCATCWDDDQGHGTHVAGTVAAAQTGSGLIGVAHEAILWAVKVLDSSGTGSFSDIAAGIRWAAREGHDIANMSLGSTTHSSLIHDACQYAYCQGMLLVAAAGNAGTPDSVIYPAAYPECIAVSATDHNDDLAGFSSRGSEVELAAPGEDITSTAAGGGTATMSGTSMAAPHVTGVGALVMAQGLTASETRMRLRNTAEDIGLSPAQQGHGLVDAAEAVDGL